MRREIKSIFLDLVSFDSAQAKVFNLVMILLSLAVIPSHYIENGHSICIFRNFIIPWLFSGKCPMTGWFANCECPACGLTRAMSRLLHGDLSGAWDYNRAVFLVLVVMVVVIMVNLVKVVNYYKKNKKIYKIK